MPHISAPGSPPAGMTRLIELAETLQAPVIDQGGRMNFPSRHPLNHSNGGRQLIANADVILGLELTDFWGTVDAFRDALVRSSRSIVKPGTKLNSINANDLYTQLLETHSTRDYRDVATAHLIALGGTLPAKVAAEAAPAALA